MNRERMDAETLYTEYGDKIRAYIQSRVRSRHDAEDLFSSVFLKITEHIGDYDPQKAAYSTWVYTITQNTVRDYFRRSMGKKDTELNEELPIPDLHADVEDKILRGEMLEKLAQALEQLPQRERDVIILRYYKGFSPKEIADALDISYANARYLQSVTLKKMRLLLEAEGF
ncbi:MAG: RNA polymerase sigma factor [Eubacteriales bacterium]|nr:RNA polymerase sigma factor [Eubacteriales bacterium]